ncbi:hypothetical protein CLAFUW4_01568 [Fulvia fulva]|uniref:Basic proline-rich protein n=1 Tax=Passalora fulva TaxID=5499 RepID=A0A9Q8L5J9_PASFU|nr:uncharacterized protein CLAFUR5_01568 [Fulvia fulva]KAK4634706.1 hypothetical protein CLAFUR4_01567 [Fulvia fulva]KAK4638149.1 hypothetical protein CLAFUR0_01568 [Fulvia fulva]UJO11231.1 hypothetical protein CLAFUR5_01568 [Fulvia fulva]WPV09696.1 hypothetical protein CLAFUW4_01568 [Fulvia fulva]WPV24906.1 hypothetical protein CLAFUW7_01571 [Fulvia fulva]
MACSSRPDVSSLAVTINDIPHIFGAPAAGDDEDEAASPMDAEDTSTRSDAQARPHLLPPLKLRPEAARSSTDPSSAALQGYTSRPTSGQRNRSPFSRSHLRSRSSGAALSAPVMTRAHSSPSIYTPTTRTFELSTPPALSLPPGSSMKTSARQRSPFRQQEELGAYNPPSRSPSWFEPTSGTAIQSIQEDSELDITPRQQLPPPASTLASFSRSSSLRRRPASPLHSSTAAGPPSSFPSVLVEQNTLINAASGSNSPSLAPQRYNETHPSLHHYASSSSFSSIPSTPTSQRSRSPSISSLDTIEDAPDLESEAVETERIERLKLAAERQERAERGEDMDDEPRRRSSLDMPRGFGFGRGSSRERKRWSVCGGERRGDLDLETIYED